MYCSAKRCSSLGDEIILKHKNSAGMLLCPFVRIRNGFVFRFAEAYLIVLRFLFCSVYNFLRICWESELFYLFCL
jgi:hypothetical protein